MVEIMLMLVYKLFIAIVYSEVYFECLQDVLYVEVVHVSNILPGINVSN